MSMPSAVKHINKVRVLEALYRTRITTRAALSRELKLMRSTVGNLVTDLISEGLVSESQQSLAEPIGRTGRPGKCIQLNPEHSIFIGADIGVGHISVVAVDLSGSSFKSQTTRYDPVFNNTEKTTDTLAAAINDFIAQLPNKDAIRGVCVTIPGIVDSDGFVLRAPTLGWESVPVFKLLEDKLQQPNVLVLENDAKAFAATELYGRSPASCTNALFIYLDVGIGGGLVSDGKLLRGNHDCAGEIGHIFLGEGGFDPDSPLRGSFESYVGLKAVIALYRKHGGDGDLAALLAALSVEEPAAVRTISDWALWLGRGIASMVSVFDPAKLILGGPLAELYRYAEADTLNAIETHLVNPFKLPSIEVSKLGPDVCAVGAAMILHHDVISINEQLVYGDRNIHP